MTRMTLLLLFCLAQEEPPVTGPWIASLHPPKAGPGAKIKLVGRRLAKEGAQTWVRISPDLWLEAEGATETEIILTIPGGTATGPLQVRVGGEMGNTRHLELVRSFMTAAPPEAIVRDKDGFAVTTLSDLSVRFKDFHGFPEAEALAKKHEGTVAGYVSSTNSFRLRFKARDLKALLALEKELEKEPGVASVNLMLGLRPR